MPLFSAHSVRREAAFTLMELMVVLTLIAILSAAIIPEMRGSFEDTVLRSSARQIIDLLGLANSRAVALNRTHQVRFDRTAGRFVIEAQTGRSSRNAAFVPIRDLGQEAGTLDHRVTVEMHTAESPTSDSRGTASAGGQEAILFYPDGTADSAEVQLRDRSGFGLALRVNPITARVRISDKPHP